MIEKIYRPLVSFKEIADALQAEWDSSNIRRMFEFCQALIAKRMSQLHLQSLISASIRDRITISHKEKFNASEMSIKVFNEFMAVQEIQNFEQISEFWKALEAVDSSLKNMDDNSQCLYSELVRVFGFHILNTSAVWKKLKPTIKDPKRLRDIGIVKSRSSKELYQKI
jgi:hypothetical protein